MTPKALKAEMHAYGAYATARLELTFATDPNWSNEVDFLMRLPDNTEATGFAYWFGDEYVVAKTVEKARAAAIYEFITSRQRDPALVEMVGRRQFRVRIAPIDPEKDLRVEIKLVVIQTRGALALPLTALFSRPLESADLTLNTPPGWTENWGRPSEEADGRLVFRSESKPWSARSDWRAAPPSKPVTASVGRPTEGEGTLLVAYTAPKAMTGVRLSAPPGVLRHVYPARIARLAAGETVTFAARIAPYAPAQARLTVGVTSWTQRLAREPFAERAAVVVWGARHVATLSDRAQIRRWGMWLGIPTKETSWLAVPTAELQALREARLALAIREYWLLGAKFGLQSAQARAAHEGARRLAREADPDATEAELEATWDWRLREGRWDALDTLGQQYVAAVARDGAKSARAGQFAAGYRRIQDGRRGDEFLRSALESALENRVYDFVDREAEDAVPASELATKKAEIGRLWRALGGREDSDTSIPYALWDGLQTAERLRLGIERDASPDDREAARRAVALAPIFGNTSTLRNRARAAVAASDLLDLANGWFYEGGKRKTPPPIEDRLRQLDQRLARFGLARSDAARELVDIVTLSPMRPQPPVEDPTKPLLTEDQERFIAHYELDRMRVLEAMYGYQYHRAQSRVYGLEVATRRNPADLAEARSALEGWAKVLKKPVPAPGTLPKDYGWERARDEYVVALRAHGPDHPLTKAARERMEKTDAGRRGRVLYRADVLRTEMEIDALSWRKLTPEEEARRAELEKKRNELFARMGDPLLVVQAPKDARVAALLPDGRLVGLAWNSQTMRWEHRFDLPPGSTEGTVVIPVWIVHSDGRTEQREVRIHVDQTPPAMEVAWKRTEGGWRVEAVTEAGVARVNVALPDGRRFPLPRIAQSGERVTWRAEIAGPIVGEAVVIATDAAHNRTEVRRSFSP